MLKYQQYVAVGSFWSNSSWVEQNDLRAEKLHLQGNGMKRVNGRASYRRKIEGIPTPQFL